MHFDVYLVEQRIVGRERVNFFRRVCYLVFADHEDEAVEIVQESGIYFPEGSLVAFLSGSRPERFREVSPERPLNKTRCERCGHVKEGEEPMFLIYFSHYIENDTLLCRSCADSYIRPHSLWHTKAVLR